MPIGLLQQSRTGSRLADWQGLTRKEKKRKNIYKWTTNGTINLQHFKKDIFGEVSDIDFSILERYKPYYKYNIEKEKVEIKDFEEDNTYEKYNYKILDVQNEENIYKINMELIKQNLVEKNEEKMANATLTLKTEGNEVYLVDYNEYN